ncbi:MAG TPA: Rrf2 family transcriptional regulator [Bacillota bacterium]|nr:Rrf2 family transcriptional regulator [Bacillota bacterium]
MKISTKGRYALRMMVDLAEHNNGEWISLKEISERQNISIKYLEQIVSSLMRSGLLLSSRGPQGGYMLSRKPEEYTVGEILREIEGSLVPVACMETVPNQCERYAYCPTIKFWEGLYKVITDYVDSVTLADLVQQAHPDVIDYSI